MRGEVIAIGDELTTGQRLDTNSQWVSERLTELGIGVAFHTTVGDDLETSTAVFRNAIDRADIVVATGGLGPTADDLTRDAIAAAVGVDLVRDAASLEQIRALFARRGRAMPERNAIQAMFPHGSKAIPNPSGTAPGIEMRIKRPCCGPCYLFALPGVPAELFEMWRASVAPAICMAVPAKRVIRHRRIKCFGVGESDLEAMLPDMIRRGREPLVGITVSGATITLRLTASGPNEGACFRQMEPTIGQIRDLLGTLVFGEEDDELEHAVVRLLAERNRTLAVSEWATDGLVTHWLADADGGRDRFRGGVEIREPRALAAILGIDVPPEAAAEAETARRMATEIRARTGAEFGLGIAALPYGSGVRGAGTSAGDIVSEPPGTLHVALATGDGVIAKGLSLASHPSITRVRAAKQALDLVRLHLLGIR